MTPLSDIGTQLITARIARGLSQRDLGELIGVQPYVDRERVGVWHA